MSNIVPYSDIERMAVAVAKSQLFGMKTPEQAIALMLVAQSDGVHPARAALEYHIINGKPALKADAMLSRFQAAGGKVEWKKYTDDEVVGIFSHPQGGSVTIEWTLAMATKAGLTGNPTWKKFSRAMLRSRCISEGIRTVYPGVNVGLYSEAEVEAFTEKDVTPTAEPAKPTPAPEAIKAKAAAMKADSAKAAKANAPVANVIEGSATVISSADEGDLSGIGNNKPDATALGKVVHAFANIGYTIESLEAEYGKRIDEWTMDDMAEARQVYALKSAERKEMLAKMAAEKAAASEATVI